MNDSLSFRSVFDVLDTLRKARIVKVSVLMVDNNGWRMNSINHVYAYVGQVNAIIDYMCKIMGINLHCFVSSARKELRLQW